MNLSEGPVFPNPQRKMYDLKLRKKQLNLMQSEMAFKQRHKGTSLGLSMRHLFC